MKICIILLVINLCILDFAKGQKKFEKNIAYSGNKKIIANLKYADDISFKTWDKNEIGITAVITINNNTNNDNFELLVEDRETEIVLTSKINDLRNISSSMVVQQNGGTYYTGGNGYWDKEENMYINVGKTISVDIDFEIFLPPSAAIYVKTINGNIDFEFQGNPCMLESVSGTINFKANEKEKLKFDIATISGDVLTNLDLKPLSQNKGELQEVGGKFDKKLSLNGGDYEIKIKTISGDIYLVKKD